MKKTLVCTLLLFLISAASWAQKEADAILGVWQSGSGKGHIQIYKQGSEYFGKIVWLKEPNDEKGKPKVDKNNPDESNRSRPVLGLIHMRNFTYDGDNVWEDGEIYDPEKGKEYSCKMTLINANTLEVRGYIGISLIGRTDTWKRVK